MGFDDAVVGIVAATACCLAALPAFDGFSPKRRLTAMVAATAVCVALPNTWRAAVAPTLFVCGAATAVIGLRGVLPRSLTSCLCCPRPFLCFLGLVIATVPYAVLPSGSTSLPPPSGPLAVGRQRHFIPTQRALRLGPTPGAPRQLVLDVFYPTSPPSLGAPHQPYEPSSPFLLNGLAAMASHAYRDAPMLESSAPLPLLVWSHGFVAGSTVSNSVLLEDLASHGVVSVSVSHPYEALWTPAAGAGAPGVGPDLGHVAAAAAKADTALEYITAMHNVSRCNVYGGGAAQVELLAGLRHELVSTAAPWTVERQAAWVADMKDAVRWATRQAGLDTSRVVMAGHSFGGTAAWQFCLPDAHLPGGAHVAGCANVDGLELGGLFETPATRPLLYVAASGTHRVNDAALFSATGGAHKIVVSQAKHMSFSDFALFVPPAVRAGLGSDFGSNDAAVQIALRNAVRGFLSLVWDGGVDDWRTDVRLPPGTHNWTHVVCDSQYRNPE